MCVRDILSDTRCDTLSHKVFEKNSRVRCICLHFLERALLHTVVCLRIIQLTHVLVAGRLILTSLAFVRRAVLQRSSLYKSVLVPASMMDTGCCAAADFKAFSLSVDMSLFPVTLPWTISTLHSKPCKHLSWRCNPDLRAQCILFGEIESISHEPTVTSGIDRVTIYELLLRHCLSPSIIHCESFLQCACGAESQTRTALTLVLHRCYNLNTALRSIPITWRVQGITFPIEPSQCDAQLASQFVLCQILKSCACLMLLPSCHVHRECAFLVAKTTHSVSDWCVTEALVQWPTLESVLLDKSKSVTSSAASCSVSVSVPRQTTLRLHPLETPSGHSL